MSLRRVQALSAPSSSGPSSSGPTSAPTAAPTPGAVPPPPLASTGGVAAAARRVRVRAGDASVIGRWWWSVDRWMLAVVLLLAGIGGLLILAAGPPAASRIHVDTFHFVRRQMVFVPVGLVIMFGVSLLSPRGVRRMGVIGFLGGMILVALTLVIGPQYNGATRWLVMGGLTLQPSELVKPLFAVVVAWLLAAGASGEGVPGLRLSLVLVAAVAVLLLSQPDVGMTLVVVAIWCTQVFLAGLSLAWVILLALLGLGGLAGAYMVFPHVQSRVNRFLDPQSGDNYQIRQAMEAFTQGGLFGRGPGEGRVKEALPDAHTDFIFAVAGEEFGLWLCLLLVALFAFLVWRALTRAMNQRDLFVMLAVGGLTVQLAMQAVINMASSLNLMPTKGMTLPFISYGGSSMIGVGLAMGMILALTRVRQRAEGRL